MGSGIGIGQICQLMRGFRPGCVMAHKKPKAAVSGLLKTRRSVHSVHHFLHWLSCHSSVCPALQRQACFSTPMAASLPICRV